MKTNWKELIIECMSKVGETLEDIESNTMSEKQMVRKFDSGWGATNGKPFTIWTKNRVYFPACYDGSEWVSFVSRNPDGKPTDHQGGG